MPRLEVIRDGEAPRSMWQRGVEYVRSLVLGPYNPRDREIARLFGATPSATGISVNEDTAMNLSAVWCAVSLISGTLGSLPLKLYKRLPGGGKEEFTGHPLYRLMHDAPNPHMSSVTFRETMQAHLLVWGNSYSEIVRDSAGRVTELWPLLPYRMSPFFEGGRLLYRYANSGGNDIIFEPQDVLHIRGLGDTGIEGHSIIARARESIGLGLATERFGATFFGNGSTFGGVISYPVGINVTPQSREDNRRALERQHQGVERAHRLLALYEGAKYEQMGVPPEDAQFLETRRFQVEEIARWFNLPPHKIKNLERATFSNIEHQSIEYVTDTLMPWIRRWEAELNLKLVSPLEQRIQFFEFNVDGLLRGDANARAQLYTALFNIGAISPNEIRAKEGLNPIPGGDVTYVPSGMTPTKQAARLPATTGDNSDED